MKIFGLIGFPLGHSFSADYFTKKFKKEKITGIEYRNFPIDKIDLLPELIMTEKKLKGFNVTIPYKEQVMAYLNYVDEEAKEIGAVNTVVVNREPDNTGIELKGYNTDGYGFIMSLKEVLKENVKQALVLGSGGASKAVIHALRSIDIRPLVVSRNPVPDQISYKDLNKKVLSSHLLIVNTSPVGTFPEINRAPDIPYHLLGPFHILHDLVYNPEETLFMKKGKERGALVKNGYQMLVEQAEKAWEIWNQN